MLYWRGCRPSQRGLLRIGSQPIQPPGCMWGRSNPTPASRQPPSQASPIFLVRKPPPCLTTQPGASGARHCGRTTLTGHHRLLVTGPAADLVRLRSAAAGAGTVPWHLDFDHMEEDLFHLLVAPPARTGALEYRARSLSLAGARILAGQLRTAAERRHGLAIAQIGHSRVCPFDLHALVPVPDAILKCGPDDPEALDWLWTHWGTTQTLRLVVEDEAATITTRPAGAGQGAAAGQGVWALTFWSADWTPWRALAQVAGSWPTLRFETRPIYDMP
jgi:hypothetical protein